MSSKLNEYLSVSERLPQRVPGQYVQIISRYLTYKKNLSK
jgi:hypothetical protein